MWNLVLYVLAVIVGLCLFFFYDADEDTTNKGQPQDATGASSPSPPSDPGQDSADTSADRFCLSSLCAVLGLKCPDDEEIEGQGFEAFTERFGSFEEVSEACWRAGLESCSLIVGIDFTASNEWKGRKSFNQNCLHKLIGNKVSNPYQKVIWILGQTLAPFDDDNRIPAFGFGDSETKDRAVFPFKFDGSPCTGFQEVLDWYNEVVRRITLSGPTSFAPLIDKTVEIVRQTKKYHMLVIVTDGQVTEERETARSIVEASNYPLSIIAVGVGDGPWSAIEEFDHRLPKRRFDNFRFVDYHRATSKSKTPDVAFALQALMEIPDQYKRIVELGYLGEAKRAGGERSGSAPLSGMNDGTGGSSTDGVSSESSSRRGTPSNSPGRASTLGQTPQNSPKASPAAKSPRKAQLKHRISNVSC